MSFVQGGSADIWKENIMEELEAGEMEYETVEEFLIALKKEFSGGEEKSVKVAELRKLEQEGRTMEEFVQEFKRAVKESGYKGRLLIEVFKRGINGGIRRKLIEAENPPASIEQWYKRAMALDRNHVTILSMAEEANAPSAGDNRTYSDRKDRKDKHGSSKRTRGRTGCGGSSKTGPLCYGGR